MTNFKTKVTSFLEKLPASISSVIIQDPRSHMSKTEAKSVVVSRMFEAIGNLYVACPAVMYSKVTPYAHLQRQILYLNLFRQTQSRFCTA